MIFYCDCTEIVIDINKENIVCFGSYLIDAIHIAIACSGAFCFIFYVFVHGCECMWGTCSYSVDQVYKALHGMSCLVWHLISVIQVHQSFLFAQ